MSYMCYHVMYVITGFREKLEIVRCGCGGTEEDVCHNFTERSSVRVQAEPSGGQVEQNPCHFACLCTEVRTTLVLSTLHK